MLSEDNFGNKQNTHAIHTTYVYLYICSVNRTVNAHQIISSIIMQPDTGNDWVFAAKLIGCGISDSCVQQNATNNIFHTGCNICRGDT